MLSYTVAQATTTPSSGNLSTSPASHTHISVVVVVFVCSIPCNLMYHIHKVCLSLCQMLKLLLYIQLKLMQIPILFVCERE